MFGQDDWRLPNRKIFERNFFLGTPAPLIKNYPTNTSPCVERREDGFRQILQEQKSIQYREILKKGAGVPLFADTAAAPGPATPGPSSVSGINAPVSLESSLVRGGYVLDRDILSERQVQLLADPSSNLELMKIYHSTGSTQFLQTIWNESTRPRGKKIE
jgi:hypothetical protein